MSNLHTSPLLAEIEAFLARSGMGESYFGKLACGNSELVKRLRNNGRFYSETEAKVRSFIKARSGEEYASATADASSGRVSHFRSPSREGAVS